MFGICRAALAQTGAGAYNMPFGESRQYSSQGSGSNGVMYGANWSHPYLPFLTVSGDTVSYTLGNAGSYDFQKSGSTYTPSYFVQDQLSYDSTADQYTVTKPSGETQVFSGSGMVLSISNPQAGGSSNQRSFNYSGGVLQSAVVTDGTEEGAVGHYYTFDDSGRLSNVAMRVGGTSAASNVRQINYSYDSNSNLEQLALQQWSGSEWTTVKNAYFRYQSGTALMSYAVEDDAFKQMHAVDPSWPQAADDATIAQYADQAFTYDSKGRVTQSSINGGKYTYNFSYTSSSFGGDPNSWASKTVVTQPDGSVRTYYYNDSSNLMLLKVVDTSGDIWYPICQIFDGDERVLQSASSAAVASVNESSPGLFTLQTSNGLIRVSQYDGNGNQTLSGLQQGSSGPLIVLEEWTYESNTGPTTGTPIYVVASDTVYRDATNTSSSNPATTTYTYGWVTGTYRIATKTTTYPVVAVSENGSDVAPVTVATYNQWGLVTNFVDAMAVVTTYGYDMTTAALTQMIKDAASGGLNLTTTYEVDALGRRTQSLGPVHTISLNGGTTQIQRASWTQYLDDIDQVRHMMGYVNVATGAQTVINPVSISVSYTNDPEVSGGRMEEDIAAVWYPSGLPDPGYTFPQADYVRWSTVSISPQNEVTNARTYYAIPASGLGVQGTNYAQTNYGYDSAGRLNQVTMPMGTIRVTTYNAMSWPLQTSVGTTLANLVPVKLMQCDGGAAGGNGNVTQVTLPVDGTSANNRITAYSYDWRNRQVQSQASDGTRTIITVNAYDNRNRVIQVNTYQNSVAPANMLTQTATLFDSWNRMYQRQVYSVDAGGGGTVGVAIVGNFYFDPVGRVARVQPMGQTSYMVVTHDTVGRPLIVFQAYGGTLNPASPWDVSTSTVLAQTEATYDAADNMIATTNRLRFANATGTGSLQDPATEPEARVYYTANYPDPLGRSVAVANYGTNAGVSWTRSATVPPTSSTVLVTTSIYDNSGMLVEIIDASGIVTQSLYDQAGRQTALVQNYQPGRGPGLTVNRTTEFSYNDDGNLVSQTLINPTTGNQVTQWIYGVTTAGGSTVNSNWLLYQKIYPDGSSPSDLVTYSYSRQGQPTKMVDQAGTSHAYSYDLFGRLTSDAISTFGPGVDTTVRSIQYTYEPRGMQATVTSYGSGTTVLNQVLRVFNSFGQLAQEYQEHFGAVNTSTTPQIAYSYANGTGNTIPTGITHPDGTVLGFGYTSSAGQAFNRPDGVSLDGSQLCTYAYLGLSTFVNVIYNAASNLQLTAETGGTGDAGDQYTALDRFGRLVETFWEVGTEGVVHSKYGRNQVGGIVWWQDLMAASLGVLTQDNYYWYDGLQQLGAHQRGQLNGTAPSYTGIVSPPAQAEDFGYDSAGNWCTSDTLNPANSQTRTMNLANEITSLTNSSASSEAPVQYDAAGNIMLMPEPGTWDADYQLVFDGWNRLVKIVASGSSSLVAGYAYDGLTRRILKTTTGSAEDFYYSSSWQVLEVRGHEHDPSSSSEAGVPQMTHFIWGIRSTDDLIVRTQSTDGGATQQLYSLADQFNVVAIADSAGLAQERYGYNSFGTPLVMTPSFIASASSSFGWETLFGGYYLDGESGLYQVRYRYLNPVLGAWMARDPNGEEAGVNLYAYVLNNPVNVIDPMGLGAAIGPAAAATARAMRCCQSQHGSWDSLTNNKYGGNFTACMNGCTGDWRLALSGAICAALAAYGAAKLAAALGVEFTPELGLVAAIGGALVIPGLCAAACEGKGCSLTQTPF